jgi:hypothetical protein
MEKKMMHEAICKRPVLQKKYNISEELLGRCKISDMLEEQETIEVSGNL